MLTVLCVCLLFRLGTCCACAFATGFYIGNPYYHTRSDEISRSAAAQMALITILLQTFNTGAMLNLFGAMAAKYESTMTINALALLSCVVNAAALLFSGTCSSQVWEVRS